MRRDERQSEVPRILLVLGFGCFLVALGSAISTPATTYELSIYAATPMWFWAGAGLAFLAGVAVSTAGRSRRWDRRGGFILAYLSSLAVVALDILRGYRFYGSADSLTHLGWVKDFSTGVLEPSGLLYPGAHTIILFVSDLGGVGFSHAGQLVVVVFAAVFLLSVPLCVRVVTDSPLAYPVGLLSALLWLPVNDVGVHRMVHPISLGAMFLPVVLYLTFSYVNSERGGPSEVGVLLATTGVAGMLVHPQLSLAIIAVLGTIAAVQYLFRRVGADHPVADHRPTHLQAAFVALFVALWTPRFDRVRIMIREVTQGLFGGAPSGDEVNVRSSSLAELGGSIEGLFVKLFAPSVVFIAIVGLFVAATWLNRGGYLFRGRTTDAQYAVVGTVPLGIAFVVLFASSVSTQHFRVLGLIMVLVTVAGAVALVALARRIGEASSLGRGKTAVVVLLLLLLPLSTMTLFLSPFIYQPTPHVTSAHLDGYETSFDHRMDGVGYTGIRDGPRRYVDAVFGTTRSESLPYGEKGLGVSGLVFERNLTTHFEDPRYLVVTQTDYEREVTLYRGFRYSKEGFRSLDTHPRIDRVQSNGVVRGYLIRSAPNGTASNETAPNATASGA